MKTETRSGKSRIWLILFLIIWCAQMLTAVYFCCQKQGFHEDEYYSYYSTARTNGFWVEDQRWMDREDYYNEYVVLEGQGFQYGLVKLVQSWDVHPPVYYWILHTVCSLFPGRFSKWFGLSINLVAFGISMFLLRHLAMQITKGNEKISWLVCLFYGFTPAVMSSVVFIRMYALLTVFVLLCAILHVKALENYKQSKDKLSVKGFLLPLAVVTYLGFLTQYYYFIFLFFMAAGFCLYLLWNDRNLWNCIRYGVSLAIAFVLAYITYPSCLGQMFRGQRGAQATDNFFDLSNTVERLQFFWSILDEYVFGKTLPVFLLVILLLFLTGLGKRSRDTAVSSSDAKQHEECVEVGNEQGSISGSKRGYAKALETYKMYWLLLFSVVGYFLVVSKTGLLLGNTSVRYQTPIYGMIVLLVFEAIRQLGKTCGILQKGEQVDFVDDREEGNKTIKSNRNNWLLAAVAILCVVINLSGLLSDRVVFLYPEDAQQVQFAREQAANQTPVVYIYDEGQSWCVWDCTNELLEYDGVFFAGQSSTELIQDSKVANSEELVVYLSNSADAQTQLQRILNSNVNVAEYELQYSEKYCDVYYLY
ncbi:MAG: glycosyltransferase family 39 protein [Lachnospiraceae bacterium]|nr:glycosyltransferase family 39 protein [Lachnospiraceae bacterium]